MNIFDLSLFFFIVAFVAVVVVVVVLYVRSTDLKTAMESSTVKPK